MGHVHHRRHDSASASSWASTCSCSRKGQIREATIIGVALLLLAVVFGKPRRRVRRSGMFRAVAAPDHGRAGRLRLRRVGAAGVDAALAARLPQLVHEDRHDRCSSRSASSSSTRAQTPAFSQFIGGGGPIIPGPLFPFVFITIACGAISGFHALIASGTTPKMIDKESDIRPIGYGAMLFEGLVGVMALIAATALHPGDYFAINTLAGRLRDPAACRRSTWRTLQAQVGENVVGRTGGAVSLAVGMAQIFTRLPGMRGLMAYWYHFAIMFEALFILTTIDSGTRVGALPAAGIRRPRLEAVRRAPTGCPARIVSTSLVVLRVGLFHLDRQHQHDLADVRRRQPAARRGRARRRHDDPHQHRAAQVRVGDVRSRCASWRRRR